MNSGNDEIVVVQTNEQGDLDDLEKLQAEFLAEDVGAGTKQQDPLNTLYKHHPEAVLDYKESVFQKLPLTSVPPGDDLDKNHKSQPFLTQYEKTRILGFRTNQLAQGARPLLLNGVPEYVKSTLEIARLELEQRRLPFLVKRPMPDGSFEYWRLSDLLIL